MGLCGTQLLQCSLRFSESHPLGFRRIGRGPLFAQIAVEERRFFRTQQLWTVKRHQPSTKLSQSRVGKAGDDFLAPRPVRVLELLQKLLVCVGVELPVDLPLNGLGRRVRVLDVTLSAPVR
jgi:hypothetical protein